MIKQTLMFTSPVSLSLKNEQLVITSKESGDTLTRPIEDIGFVIIDNPMVSVTDRQYGDIVNYWGNKEEEKKKILSEPVQLEIIW